MGAINASGIYVYDNTDQMIPHATYSNLLANSVTAAVDDLQAQIDDVPHSTGTFTAGGGMTDSDCNVWLRDGIAGIEFTARLGTVAHNTGIGTLALAYRPPWTVTVQLAPNSTLPSSAFIQIQATGVTTFFMYGGGSATTLVRGNAVWPKTL